MFSASKTSGLSGYNLTNSLRFRSSASAYLNRTPASASNRKTWTWSAWVKKAPIQGSANTLATLMGCTTGSNDSTYLRFGFYQDRFIVGNFNAFFLQSTSLYRDPSAWYHVLVSTDTTQGSASNRMRIYINSVEITAWSTDQRSTYLTSSVDLGINQATQHSIGSSLPNAGDYLDGYLDEINFIDGQALTPSSFGSFNATTGVWQPARYTGTYGTNGFYLNFTDIALTSGSNTGLGRDFSGNGNFWNTNNISVTAGVTYDAMRDVPTLTSATVANYAVLSPIWKDASATVLDANLRCFGSGATDRNIFATMSIPSNQKIYFEANVVTGTSVGNYFTVGIAPSTLGLNTESGLVSGSFGINSDQANASFKRISGTSTSYGAGTSYATNDIVQIAIDQANGRLWFGKNNTWFDSGNPSAGTNPATSALSTTVEYFPCFTFYQSTPVLALNFGQRPFAYTPPTGFVALNTFNLPTSTIVKGNNVMDATLWTGNGTTQTITNAAGFRPDFVWIKSRAGTNGNSFNLLYDSIRGAGIFLSSNTTNAEAGNSGDLLGSFNSNGFSVNNTLSGASNPSANGSGTTFVGWQWQAGSSTVTNTNGSISSQVRVNPTAGFSVVTYTGLAGDNTNRTIGHGLGVAPAMIIIKNRNWAATDVAWAVWNQGASNQALFINSTAAGSTTDFSRFFGGTAPTSTVFTTRSDTAVSTANRYSTQGRTDGYVAYCWAEIAGFSRFGSYTGNGSADGPFVFTGFRPKFVMIKNSGGGATSSLQGWVMQDTSRSPFNQTADTLFTNNANASSSNSIYAIDILSNGFKTRGTDGAVNESSATYVYMAFAESPFKNSLAR